MDHDREALRPCITDMIAFEKHILKVLDWQLESDDIRQFPNAHQLLDRLAGVLRQHLDTLEDHLTGFPTPSGSTHTLKEALISAIGSVSGMYDKAFRHWVSRVLRDDLTALSFATISYTIFHATAVGLRQGATAELALRHLKDLTPIVIELNEVLPHIVLRELALEEHTVEMGLAEQAVRNIQEAWSSEHTRVGGSELQ